MMNEDRFDELMFDFYLFTQLLDVFGINSKKVFEEDILWDQYRKDDICFNVAKYMYEEIKKRYIVRENREPIARVTEIKRDDGLEIIMKLNNKNYEIPTLNTELDGQMTIDDLRKDDEQ